MIRLFSNRSRPPHLGPYPLELLPRTDSITGYTSENVQQPLDFSSSENPCSVSNAMPRFFQLYNSLRDGNVSQTLAPIPDGVDERTNNLKSACYFLDASVVGVCAIPTGAILETPLCSSFPDVAESAEIDAENLLLQQQREFAQELKSAEPTGKQDIDLSAHKFAVAILIEYTRDPGATEPGFDWIDGSQGARAALRAAEVAVVMATYIRRLGWAARAHIATGTELNHDYIALAAGVGEMTSANGTQAISNPFLGTRFGIAVVSTTMELAADLPLAERGILANCKAFGPSWWLGVGGTRPAWKRITGQRRPLHKGTYPMEKIKRVNQPTTYINPAQIKRVAKRHEFFNRANFGDLGDAPKRESVGWRYSNKEPFGAALGLPLLEGVPLQYGVPADTKAHGSDDPKKSAQNIKALCHYLGADMVGITPAYEYLWYSHDHDGTPIQPYHKNAVVIVIDQSQETMAGSSGDDWISGAQSMRAYMRGALVTGVVAEYARRLGWSARSHTMVEEDVLQIPMLLNAGLGEMSRIGELVLNPFVGPRLKCAVITTDLPLEADKPIDFGLQDFCRQCNKCARECPCQAIPHGDKILFNGYEIWKPDVQKCASYRITNAAGALCGRCMVTCPYQSEGVLTNRIVLWAAVNLPFARKWIAKLDDMCGSGIINPIKKWWFDLEDVDGVLGPARKTNVRKLNFSRKMEAAKQKIAVFPPELAPPPDAKETVLVDRKLGRDAQLKCERDLQNLHSTGETQISLETLKQ